MTANNSHRLTRFEELVADARVHLTVGTRAEGDVTALLGALQRFHGARRVEPAAPVNELAKASALRRQFWTQHARFGAKPIPLAELFRSASASVTVMALRRGRIYSVQSVVRMGEADAGAVFGANAVPAIRDVLALHGLHFNMKMPEMVQAFDFRSIR